MTSIPRSRDARAKGRAIAAVLGILIAAALSPAGLGGAPRTTSAESGGSWGLFPSQTLSANSITPTNPGIDSGQSVTLTANPSGGTPPYGFQWYSGSTASGCTSLASPIPSTNSTTYVASPVSSTYYCYNVTDSASDVAYSLADLVAVNPTLAASSPTPSGPTIDSGQSIPLTANPVGGTPPDTYQWYDGSTAGACTDMSSAIPEATLSTYTAAPTTSTYYCYDVADSSMADQGSESGTSGADLVTVSSGFSAGAPTPTSPSIDVGQSIVLSSNPSGGTQPYSYQWYSSPKDSGACDAGTALGTSGTQSVAPVAGTYYCYEVTDSSQSPATLSSGWDKVVANPAPSAGAPSPPTSTIDFGQSLTLTSHAMNGTAPYAYRWHWSGKDSGACGSGTALGAGSTQTTGSEVTGTGTYYYCYVVTDSSQGASGAESASSTWATVQVNSTLAPPPAPTPSATALDVDQVLAVSGALPSSGAPPFSWQWRDSVNGASYSDATQCGSSQSGSGGASGGTVTCSIPASKLTAKDTYTFELRVTDSASSPGTATSPASATVTVHSALTAPAAPTPSSASLDANQSLTVSGKIPSTGTPSYSWEWLISVNGAAYSPASPCGASASGSGATGGTTKSCLIPGDTLSASTSYAFELKVSDNATLPESKTSAASPTVTTSSALTAGVPSPSSATIDGGQSVVLTSNPSGGSGTYSYQWYSGSTASACTSLSSPVSGATSSSYAASPTTTTYYCYSVTDSRSVTAASFAASVLVNSPLTLPGAPTPSATALDDDQALSVTATIPTTGTPSYDWQWLVSFDDGFFTPATNCAVDAGNAAAGGSAETCAIAGGTLSIGGTYVFELNVTDNATVPESATSPGSSTVAVDSALTAPTGPAPSATSIGADEALTVTGTIPSNGTPTYSWQWLVSANGAAEGPAAECGTSASGSGAVALASETCSIPGGSLSAGSSYTFELEVTDSATAPETQTSTASPTVMVTTSSVLSAGAPSPSSPTIDNGQSVSLTANPSGGSGSYSYQWYSGSTASACTGLSNPLSGATSSTYTASPTVTTYYCYSVTDGPAPDSGRVLTASGWDLVTVNPALALPAEPTASATTLNISQPMNLTGTIPSTGTPPYTWTWLVSVNGGGFSPATQCDLDHGSGATEGAIETCNVAPNTLVAGDTYAFELQVTDSAFASVTVTSTPATVTTLSSSTPGSNHASFPWLWVDAGIALTAAAVAAVLVAFWTRRRRTPTQGTALPGNQREGQSPATPRGPTAPVAPALPTSIPIERPVPTASFPSKALEPSVVPQTTPVARPQEERTDVDSVLAELDDIGYQVSRRTRRRGPGETAGGSLDGARANDPGQN